MAITFDAQNSSSATGVDAPSSILTYALTVGAGADFLVVDANCANLFAPTRPTVTYNGVGLTLGWEAFDNVNPLAAVRYISQFYLAAPATGTNNVVVTFAYPGSTNRIASGARSYVGVHQTVSIGTPNSAQDLTGNTTTATVNITSAVGELVVDDVWAQDALATTNPPLTAGVGQTERWKIVGYAGQTTSSAGSDEAGAATVTMSWAIGVVIPIWMIGGMPLKPAAASDTLFAQAVM